MTITVIKALFKFPPYRRFPTKLFSCDPAVLDFSICYHVTANPEKFDRVVEAQAYELVGIYNNTVSRRAWCDPG